MDNTFTFLELPCTDLFQVPIETWGPSESRATKSSVGQKGELNQATVCPGCKRGSSQNQHAPYLSDIHTGTANVFCIKEELPFHI